MRSLQKPLPRKQPNYNKHNPHKHKTTKQLEDSERKAHTVHATAKQNLHQKPRHPMAKNNKNQQHRKNKNRKKNIPPKTSLRTKQKSMQKMSNMLHNLPKSSNTHNTHNTINHPKQLAVHLNIHGIILRCDMNDLYPGFLLPVWNWKTPATDIPEQVNGNFRVVKRVVKAGTAWPMCKTLGYDYCIFMNEATLTLLQEKIGDKWRDWMVDSPYEWFAMGEYAIRAMPPNVLVGGLGLGLILHHLTLRKDIEKIVVVELSKEIIEMISPYVPKDDRIEIIQGNFFEVIPKLVSERNIFNTVIVDIWAGDPYNYIEDFKKALALLYSNYPNAMHLFHPLQKIVDKEIIAQNLEGVKKPIRFIPKTENNIALG